MAMTTLAAEEVFRWKDLSVQQHENVFKVGTDALLLGAWVSHVVEFAHDILDIGTGTGVLSLMVHRTFKEANFMAIDTHEEAVSLARYNFSNSSNPLSFTCAKRDVFDLRFVEKYDLIICNPPYFFSPGHLHQGTYSPARHAKENGQAWMTKIASLIKPKGHVCMVLPFGNASEWIKAANDGGLFVNHRKNVFSFKTDAVPKRVLLHFTNTIMKPDLSQMHIYSAQTKYAAEYHDLVTGNHPKLPLG